MVPFLIAFETHLDIVQYLDTFVDVMFIFDIILTFFTTYVESGEIITNGKQIRRHYLRGWFLGDCFGAFPFSFVMYAINKKESVSRNVSLSDLPENIGYKGFIFEGTN